jgi:flavin-dependent dehydrogenase
MSHHDESVKHPAPTPEIAGQYDVAIVGGRAAGSTLAARLAMAGWRVLLLERSPMPSLPGASCPIINASTLKMLDEIGADEAEYAHSTPKIRRMITDMVDMQARLTLPDAHGRDYAYAIDRARFDGALFAHAGRFATVTACDRFSMTDLLRDDAGRVVGLVGQRDGVTHTVHARIVVGADGRFSTVARKAGAAESDVRDEHPTSLLYAYWRGVSPFDDDGAAVVAYGDNSGMGLLVMDSAEGTTAICIEGRADLLEAGGGKTQDFYRAILARFPSLEARIADAEQITPVKGMKRVGNLYRQPGGAGWALVGDAYHQKDPADGQGIYDAVLTAKLLAEAIDSTLSGRKAWDDALIDYDNAARAETYPMYLSTMQRIQASFYVDTPEWLTKLLSKTVARWVMEDPLAMESLGRVVTRQVKPRDGMPVSVAVGALVRGPLRDFSQFLQTRVIDA